MIDPASFDPTSPPMIIMGIMAGIVLVIICCCMGSSSDSRESYNRRQSTSDKKKTNVASRRSEMQKTYICLTCSDFFERCKLVVDDDDHAPTHCPYQTQKIARWREVAQ